MEYKKLLLDIIHGALVGYLIWVVVWFLGDGLWAFFSPWALLPISIIVSVKIIDWIKEQA